MTKHRYNAQQEVREGIYWNPRRLAFTSIEEPGRLPGEEGDTFYKVPALLVLPMGLLLSLAFIVFLPIVGFVMLGTAIAAKARRTSAGDAAASGARVLRPASWSRRAAAAKRKAA